MESLIIPHLGGNGVSKETYLKIIDSIETRELLPHEFVDIMMTRFKELRPKPDRSIHGKYFEYVIGEALAQNGVTCMYHQADVLHVPLATFDWFLYHETHPVSISCKTKARDRWKQAAHEAMALKQVYVQATNYLITIEPTAMSEIKKTLVPFTIDHFVTANVPEFSKAVIDIAKREYVEAIDRSPVRKGKFVAVA